MTALALRALAWLAGARLPLWLVAALTLALGAAWLARGCQLDEARQEAAGLRSEVSTLSARLGRADAEAAQWRLASEEQGEAVERWLAEAELQQGRAEAAERRQQEIRVVTRERVVEVLRAPIPSDCPAAVRWGAEQAAALGAAWEAGR